MDYDVVLWVVRRRHTPLKHAGVRSPSGDLTALCGLPDTRFWDRPWRRQLGTGSKFLHDINCPRCVRKLKGK